MTCNRGGKGPQFLKPRWVAAIILLIIAAPIVAYQCFDVHPVSRGRSPMRTHVATMILAEALRKLPARADIENAADLRRVFETELPGPDLDRGYWLHLDAPACYTAVDAEAGILVTLYDRIAVPLPVLIPSDGTDLLWDAAGPADPATGSTGER